MLKEELVEVIKYAIERELEAADFYKDLQTKVKIQASKEMLKTFEKMELGHADILKNLDLNKIELYKPEKVNNLKLSDFMVEPVTHEEMTFQEILVIAMKREEAANKMYLYLADSTDDDRVKNLFLKLATEEAKHKLQLETMYDEEINYEF
ncbi:rubrerythrin [Bacteroidetes/Chlorobi group bacterium ChocPot_Mid]|jgi:rubrerythrin|nr:MAG: rubrerythrin [Bacteroidetes/Chlorobi group bacterium ChocPot_Mid]